MLNRFGILVLSILLSIPLAYAIPPLVEFGNTRLSIDSPAGPFLSAVDQQKPLVFTIEGSMVSATSPTIVRALFHSPTSDISFAAAGLDVDV
jgi:hypothetical protein